MGRDSRSIYFLQGGGIYTLAIGAAPADRYRSARPRLRRARGPRRARRRGRSARHRNGVRRRGSAAHSPSSVKMEIDIPAERRQVFEEAWRVMKNRFYDPKMHGVNWAAAKDKYESHAAPHRRYRGAAQRDHGDDRRYERVATPGSPAARACPAQRTPRSASPTRYPGFDLEPDASGYYKVGYIYRKGPADHDYVKIAPGNFILAVNGKELKTTRELLEALQHSARAASSNSWSTQQARDRWRVDDRPGTAHRRRHEQPAIRSLGGRPQADGRQTDQRRDRLPAHQGDGRARRSPSSSATCWRTRTRRR